MEYDLNQIMRLVQSPAGKQLMELLQSKDQGQLQSAAAKASGGDFDAARKELSSVLNTPQIQALLRQLEGEK